jgi:hypothetical protein
LDLAPEAPRNRTKFRHFESFGCLKRGMSFLPRVNYYTMVRFIDFDVVYFSGLLSLYIYYILSKGNKDATEQVIPFRGPQWFTLSTPMLTPKSEAQDYYE